MTDIAALPSQTSVVDATSMLTSEAKLLSYATLRTQLISDLISDNLVVPSTSKSLSQVGTQSLLAAKMTSANNLSDVGSVATSRANLGLGTSAVLDTGTLSGNVPVVGTSSATTTLAGTIQLATNAEVTAGINTAKAIVPSAFAASKFNALNLIATATAASSASIDFTGLNSDYSKYIIEIQDLLPVTNGATVIGRVSIDNGVNYITGSSYISSCVSHNPAASWASHNGATSGAGITSSAGGAGSYGLSNTSTKGLSGVITIHNPSSVATHKKIEANGCYDDAAGDFTQFLSAGAYEGGTSAVNAFRILLDTGNIASGSFKLFGVK